MAMNYNRYRAWSDKFIPSVKNIVGPLMLEESIEEKDMAEATDLVLLKARGLDIACRVRKLCYADEYGDEFTIRSKTAYGGTTEIDKIVNGFGDWMFYGFGDEETLEIPKWSILDLNSFRSQSIRNKDRLCFSKIKNGDGTEFVSFKIDSFIPKPKLVLWSCS